MWPDNARYEGTYEDEKKQGRGRLILEDSSASEGEFGEDLIIVLERILGLMARPPKVIGLKESESCMEDTNWPKLRSKGVSGRILRGSSRWIWRSLLRMAKGRTVEEGDSGVAKGFSFWKTGCEFHAFGMELFLLDHRSTCSHSLSKSNIKRIFHLQYHTDSMFNHPDL